VAEQASAGSPPLATGMWLREHSMRRSTWLVVTIAFVIWVMLAVALGRWASGVLEVAAAQAPATVSISSGVVLYREANQRTEVAAPQGMKLFDGDELATSPGSDAELSLFDGTLADLFQSARLRVDVSRIGRFNPAVTQARLTLMNGAMRLSIPQIQNKAHTVNVYTPHGGAAFVPGEYTVRVTADATRISVWDGRSAAAVADQIVELSPGQKIILAPDRVSYQVVEVLENIVLNGDFSQNRTSWEFREDREQGRPDVAGSLAVVTPTGPGAPAQALQIKRHSQVDAHNETGLRQVLNRDVTGARGIQVRAKLRVDDASLSGGGYLGSEYPMMLRVRYRDSRGAEQVWTQGFYYANPENRPTALGQMVERGKWTDVSFDLTQPRNSPSTIDSIEVFGAGHTFDASVGAIQLLVD
jgi:hypothetical protein